MHACGDLNIDLIKHDAHRMPTDHIKVLFNLGFYSTINDQKTGSIG